MSRNNMTPPPVMERASDPSDRHVVLREAAAWGWSFRAAIPGHQWDDMRDAKVRQLVERVNDEAFSGAIREAIRWGSWEGRMFSASQWEAERDLAIARILLLQPKPRPEACHSWQVVRERRIAAHATAHAGETGVLVELADGRKAWGFGVDGGAAETAAVERAHAIHPAEDPDDDMMLAVESWTGASVSDLPIKALEHWSDFQWIQLNAPFLKTTVPFEYAGVIKDAPCDFNEYNTLDFKQSALDVLAIDDAGMALVRESVFYNYQDVDIDTLVVLPQAEVFAKVDRYRMNARIHVIEDDVFSSTAALSDEYQEHELILRCRKERDQMTTEKERGLFTERLAARGHDISDACLEKAREALAREAEQIEREADEIDAETRRYQARHASPGAGDVEDDENENENELPRP